MRPTVAFLTLASLAVPIMADIKPRVAGPTPRPASPLRRRDDFFSGGIGASFISTVASVDATVVSAIIASAAADVAAAGGDKAVSSAAATTTATNVASAAAASTTVAKASSSTKGTKASTTTTPAASTSTTSSSSKSSSSSDIDVIVLNLALTLERLEAQFYSYALSIFSLEKMIQQGLTKEQATIVIEEVQAVQSHENAHVGFLEDTLKALGQKPNLKCNFNTKGALTDARTFLAVARTLEAVGVSAYLGAAALLTDKVLLTAAATIVTLESRHQSLFNSFNGGQFAPQAFDIPLGVPDVLSLAGGFLTDCVAEDLGLETAQPLAIIDSKTRSTSFQIGSKLEFSSTIDLTKMKDLNCQMFVGGASKALVFPVNSCVVPPGINGIVAITLTNSSTPLSSNVLDQDVTHKVTGTGIIFVDSVETELATLFTFQSDSSNNKKINRKNIPSANMGRYFMNNLGGGNKSNQQSIIIESTTIITEPEIIIIDESDNSKNSKSGGGIKSSKSTKPSSKRRNVPRRLASF